MGGEFVKDQVTKLELVTNLPFVGELGNLLGDKTIKKHHLLLPEEKKNRKWMRQDNGNIVIDDIMLGTFPETKKWKQYIKLHNFHGVYANLIPLFASTGSNSVPNWIV